MQTLSEKKRELGVDFQFRNDKNTGDKNQAIELLESGLIFAINTIRFEEPTPEEIEATNEGDMVLRFNYDILENPNNVDVNTEIEVLIGDVIASLVLEALTETFDESRTDNTESVSNE